MNEFILLNTAKVDLDSRWNYKQVISPFYRLYYVESGDGQVSFNGEVRNLQGGYLYLIPSFTLSNYACESALVQYYLHIEEVLKTGISIKQDCELAFEIKASQLDVFLLNRILEINPNRSLINPNPKQDRENKEVDYRKTPSIIFSNSVETKGIILQLISRFIIGPKTSMYSNTKGINRISSALQYIHEHYEGELSVKEIADVANLNEDYFSRLFLEVIACRPVVYISQVRIERAQHLLLFSDLSIDEISESVGFSNRTYFAKMFKRLTGKTAGQYRKQANVN